MMKVLWIVNSVLNSLSKYLYNKESNGLWMDALLNDYKKNRDFDLVIVTVTRTKETIKLVDEGIIYYALPNDYPLLYDENNKSNIEAFRRLLEDEKPDLIQIWGTEFTHGLCALRLAKNIPTVIYMQGINREIAKYYYAGIDEKDIKENITFRDILKKDSIVNQKHKFELASIKENEMLNLTNNVICENNYCENIVKSINSNLNVYKCPLSINKVFYDYNWNINNIERHSIICTASGYTIKGLHILLKAVAMLKFKYEDIKVYVPGTKVEQDKDLVSQLRKNGYSKYIERLIKDLRIENNVVWLGNLKQEELAKYYSKSHTFVLPSSIENHSSSLKEAMIVGMPCIATSVGGIPEYLKNNENGLLYQYDDFNTLYSLVDVLFENDEYACELANKAKQDVRKLHNLNIYEVILRTYLEIYNNR